MVLELRHGHHAFRLVADVDDHVLRSNLQHGTADNLVFVQSGFGLGLLLLKCLQSSGEIFHGGLFFGARGCRSRASGLRAGLRCRLGVRLGSRLVLGLFSGFGLGLLSSSGFLGRGRRGVVGFFERHELRTHTPSALKTE